MNYKDSSVLFKVLVRIKHLRLRYFINASGVVETYWLGTWKPYHEVMVLDPRLVV